MEFSKSIIHTMVLSRMPEGKRYEDRYGAYLKVFEEVARVPRSEIIKVVDAPASWVPLLTYLNCEIISQQKFFPCDADLYRLSLNPFTRTKLEILCGYRPETVDALWKCDAQWFPKRIMQFPPEREFIVTNNGSFFRQEVKEYLVRLDDYMPRQRNVILIPCAADKPYPAHMHQAVLNALPDTSWYVANVTGVLGIIPQDLWPIMPHYDSGIPNRWRVIQAVSKYFKLHRHERIIVYCDFYNEAIELGLMKGGIQHITRVDFINEIKSYDDYLPLHEPRYLDKLRLAFNS